MKNERIETEEVIFDGKGQCRKRNIDLVDRLTEHRGNVEGHDRRVFKYMCGIVPVDKITPETGEKRQGNDTNNNKDVRDLPQKGCRRGLHHFFQRQSENTNADEKTASPVMIQNGHKP